MNILDALWGKLLPTEAVHEVLHLMRLEITEAHRAQARLDVVFHVIGVGFQRTRLDRAAILAPPGIKPCAQLHPLRLQIRPRVHGCRDRPELLRNLRRRLSIDALADDPPAARINARAVSDLPQPIFALTGLCSAAIRCSTS